MNIRNYIPLAFITLSFLSACSSTTTSSEADVSIPVSVEEVTLGNIEQTINSTGTIVADGEATLSTEAEGAYYVRTNPKTGKPFALGDKVSSGQTIIELKSAEYVNGLGLESKKLSLEIAEQTYEKQKSLYDKGGVTQSELSDAEVALVNAKDSYDLAQIQNAKLYVKVPFSGVITSLPIYTKGTMIASGTEVLTVMSYNKMSLDINLPEKYINDLTKGMEVRVMNYTLPDDTLVGHVSQLSPAISTETRTFVCRIEVENDSLKLRPGMFVQTDIVLDRKENVIVIPKDVVLSSRRGKVVYVVSQSTAEQKQVTFGYEDGENVEITSGLKANDRLVTKGYETLRDRSKVKIVK